MGINSLASIDNAFRVVDPRLINEMFYCPGSIQETKSLPNLPGIYLVVPDSSSPDEDIFQRCLYVGISETSIRKRWASHHKYKLLEALTRISNQRSDLWIYIWVFLPGMISSQNLRYWEQQLISLYNPPLNNLSAMIQSGDF